MGDGCNVEWPTASVTRPELERGHNNKNVVFPVWNVVTLLCSCGLGSSLVAKLLMPPGQCGRYAVPCCKGSQIHRTALAGLPQWCDQQFKKNQSILFFAALHTSLCNARQANAFWGPLGGRTAGVAYIAATRQGNTYSKCDLRIQIPRHSTPDA